MAKTNSTKRAAPRSSKKATKRKVAAPKKVPKKRVSSKTVVAKPKKRAKKSFTIGTKQHWQGAKYTILYLSDADLVALLYRVMTVHEDYSRNRDTARWYVEEDELKIKYRRLQNLVQSDPKEYKALQPLLDHVETHIAARMGVFQANVDAGFVTFDNLWLLYYEGQEIVYDDNGAFVAGRIEKAKVNSGWGGLRYAMSIKVLAHDGQKFTETTKHTEIPYFEAGQRINNLPARPVTPGLKNRLSERGARVLSMIKAGSSYVHYTGECIERSWWGTKRYRADGRVMLDPKTHKKINENYERRLASGYDDDGADEPQESGKPKVNEIGEEDYWRIAPWVAGFSFAAKQWGEFNIEEVQEIQFNTKAYDQLVLPERKVDGLEIHPKKMIRSLVEHGAVGFTDVIADKGGGIIFLLHGPPGTGKTLTAEAIADLLERPLYSVSVGELGTKTADLEKNLRMVLEVATMWNAVLLIDEADIFLERRTPRDIERNALVAIFLRMLEYYQGVLFLTTNRVKQFDRAFNSRLSIALHYPDHDLNSRKAIWNNLLLAAKLDPSKFDLKKLASEEINGRQIKHAIRIGMSLAANDERTVVFDDFMKTIRLAQHFNNQLETEETNFGPEDEPTPVVVRQVIQPPGSNGSKSKRPRA